MSSATPRMPKPPPNPRKPQEIKKSKKPAKISSMNSTLCTLLIVLRNGLAEYNNYRLNLNCHQMTNYTKAIEKVISALTDLLRFH